MRTFLREQFHENINWTCIRYLFSWNFNYRGVYAYTHIYIYVFEMYLSDVCSQKCFHDQADSLKLVHPYKKNTGNNWYISMIRLLQREISTMRKIRGSCYRKWLRSGQLHSSVTFLCDLSEVMALELKSKWRKRIRHITISGPSLRHRAKQLRHWDRNKLVQWAWSWHAHHSEQGGGCCEIWQGLWGGQEQDLVLGGPSQPKERHLNFVLSMMETP